MAAIEDTGELLPYAKKHMLCQKQGSSEKSLPNNKDVEQITLKSLWPEPDWKGLYAEGYPKDLLATIYGYYHSLRAKPKEDAGFSQSGVKITVDMWKKAYIESVYFIKEWCESAISLESLNNIDKAFRSHFDITKNSKVDYQLYAAGRNTGKTWFHALGSPGKFDEYKRLLPYLDWPINVVAKNINLFPIELTKRSNGVSFYLLCDVNLKSLSWAHNSIEYPTYEDAVNGLLNEHSDTFLLKTNNGDGELYIPRKKIKNLVNAPEHFDTISASSLMNDFGFRGIQFGNALSNNERQLFISNTYHAFQVIALILNIPTKWIGFGGLGLAFGARGSGNAAAHFEPTLNIINLTRFNGPGAIAHEFFHSIDNRLAKKCGYPDKLYSELSFIPDNDDIQQRINAFKVILVSCTDKNSSYYKCAKALGSQKGGRKYWTENCELMARAFEAYIQDTIEEKNLESEWASTGTKEMDYKSEMHPYPTGKERSILNEIFKNELKVVFQQ
tara:strand:- start:9014 stop:10513 length:1500 start_codon:yes stop_codon:yes gene_type:complete